jgi:hypothetical protein
MTVAGPDDPQPGRRDRSFVLLEQLLHTPAGDARGERERAQVIAPGPAGVEVVGFEHRPDTPAGILELAVRAAEDQRLPATWRGQSQQQPQRRGLARAVGPEKARERSLRQRERK